MKRTKHIALLLLAIVSVIATSARVFALPDQNEPVDPSKRAPISTADAIQPAAMPVQGNGVIGGRVIRMSEIPITRATISTTGNSAPVAVKESREKKVITPEKRDMKMNKAARVQRAASLPASIPRVDEERYRKMISAYQQGKVPADALLNTDITLGDRRVSIGDINRYANPRAALEAQGIPVTPAASGNAPEASSAPVPVSQEKK